MTTQLTPTQHAILTHAHQHSDGKIDWFPDNTRGGARTKVLEGLAKRALIGQRRNYWFMTTEGYAAIGVQHKPQAGTRENSKQAQVIAMLQRPEGATIAQICEATGWLAHTVRGTFAGAFKKRLGLTITSEKAPGSERVYRIS
ncbi:DUF3489 domain-containing protein [Ralstonia sp.]|uniref:DUF3489 domain-containing protein n=1 Tax=Ralstonia sp. TaxID=54061 RepID=UPI0031DF0BE4